MNRDFEMTRTAGLGRLGQFIPQAGRAYAAGRNADHGPDGPTATSALSPYLRRRLVLEREVVDAAMGAHSPSTVEKFVQEVFWRSYFKGHLETRPWIWTDTSALVAEGTERLAAESGLRQAHAAAIEGRTGIDCFDDWARELVATNWLHNHTRMWFASIWIFTLGLPWALGADFFMRHLIDGDPASNTLSWRWVAGLHTRGKPYAARAENISRYTDGRYAPTGLNERPVALDEPPAVPPIKLPPADTATGDVALLLHLDDLHPESLPLDGARIVRIVPLVAHADDAAEPVRQADRAAMADALARAKVHFDADEGAPDDLPLVTAWAPVGPSAAALPPCQRIRRSWDERAWPRSTRGFFQLKEAIPKILADAQGLRP